MAVHIDNVGSPEISFKCPDIIFNPCRKEGFCEGRGTIMPRYQILGIDGVDAVAGSEDPVGVIAFHNFGRIVNAGRPALSRNLKTGEKEKQEYTRQ